MKRITLPILAFILAFSFYSNGYGQIIMTIAGNGTAGFSGDGGMATAALVNFPAWVTVSNSGEVYIGDAVNSRIRKISTTGIITTFAGSGAPSFYGDGGPATATQFSAIGGMAIDSATGNFYVGDNIVHRIRKIDNLGIVSTIAGNGSLGFSGDGGPATLATLNDPWGICVDAGGNVYVADRYNERVRKVSNTGIITTVAGRGTAGYGGDGGAATNAQLNSPTDVAFDRSGNLFIADFNNHVIRMVNTSGIISTIAGTPTVSGGSGDGGAATAARLSGPFNIAIDQSGSLYISDVGNDRVRRVDRAGVIRTYVGTGVPGFSGDGGPATAAKIYLPAGLAVDRTGNLFLSDQDNQRIRKITSSIAVSANPGDTVCSGTSVFFSVPTVSWCGSTTYQWYVNGTPASSGSPFYSYAPNNHDSISCVVTSSGAPCGSPVVASSSVVMTVVNILPISGTRSINLCSGASSTLTSGPAWGAWSTSNAGIATIGSLTGTVTGVGPGTANITYTIVPGCYTTSAVTVNTTVPQIFGNNRICTGDTTTLHNLAGGGVWTSDSPAVASISSSGLVTGISAGTTVISYSFGTTCVKTDTVTVYPTPVISGYSNVCAGDTVRLTTNIAGGTWQSSAPGIATVTGGLVSGIATGTAVITYSNGTSCVAFHPMTVSIKPNAGAINGDDELCPGAVTRLSETIGGGTWTSKHTYVATVDSTSGIVTGVGEGSTVITYTVAPNGAGCSNWAIFSVVVSPNLLALGYSVKDPKCFDSKGSISVSVAGGKGPYLFSWSNGMSGSIVDGLTEGTYVVDIKDSGTHCTLSGTFHVVAPDSPQVTSEVHKDACSNNAGSISVTVTGGKAPYRYQWSTGDSTDEVTRLRAGDYTVTITDSNGCVKNMSFTVTDTACGEVIVHDAISPNGDGINDEWVIEDIDHFPSATVQLFDKWGSMVLDKTNYKNDWSGGSMPDGTYYYLVKLNASGSYAGKNNFTGTLLIKR